MGKYLDIFRSVDVAGPVLEQPRRGYDINDINDKRSDHHEEDSSFGRLSRLCRTLQELEHRCPAYIDPADWQRAIEDGRRFVTKWGEQAEVLGWTSADLFRLHTPPEKPAPSYRRLSRYDQTGLIWLLRGRSVIALTSTEAVILCHSGVTLKFCRAPKPPWRRPSTPSRRSAGRRQRRSSPWRREVTQARENGNDKSVFTLLTIAPRAGKI
jgi:hypothetical protein